MVVNSGATLNIANLTIANGIATLPGGGDPGSEEVGGGIDNFGTLTVTNSTFSANNTGIGTGSGIYNRVPGTATVKSSILASESNDCVGVTDGGYNISDCSSCGFTSTGIANNGDNVNPQLSSASLFANGGPTETIALQSTSPAIGATPPASCTYPSGSLNPCSTSTSTQLTCDQRGYGRPAPGQTNCDIGAYEYGAVPLSTPTLTATPTVTPTSTPTPTPTGTPTATQSPTPTGTPTPNPTAMPTGMPTPTATPTATPTPRVIAEVQPSYGVFYSPFFDTSPTQQFRLTNTGNAALNIYKVTISSAFRITASTCGATLGMGKSCLVKVNFKATHALVTTGKLSFSDSAANTPQTASLYGIGLFLFSP